MNGDETDVSDEQNDADSDGLSPAEQPSVSAVSVATRKRAEGKQKKHEREDLDFQLHMWSSEAGRRFAWSILQNSHAFETRFACGPVGFPDDKATWFHAGEQDLGLRFYQTWLLQNPEGVMQMHRECDARFASLVAKSGKL